MLDLEIVSAAQGLYIRRKGRTAPPGILRDITFAGEALCLETDAASGECDSTVSAV